MTKKKYLYIILCLLFVFAALLFLYVWNNNKILSFKIDEDFNENFSVLVDNEPVFKKPNNIIIPITMTSIRPISVTIEKQTKRVKIKNISKTVYLPIEIKFKDRQVKYYIQTLPEMFPDFIVNNPTKQKGYVLTSLFGKLNIDPSYCAIIDMNGNILYYRGNSNPTKSQFHLKRFILPNGKIRYATHSQVTEDEKSLWVNGYYLILDEKFNVKDKVKILKTKKHPELYIDEHDLIMLDDGHYIAIAYDKKNIILKNGKTVEAIHSVIQEQKKGEVIFDWTSEDYPTLMELCYEKCPGIILDYPDYIHINSIAIDKKDNNLIISSASGYYIAKINRKTGKIMWFLGGKANQFDIPNGFDFVRQHDAKYLNDGRLVFLDNHNLWREFVFKDDIPKIPYTYIPEKTRIILFDLDEQNKKVLSAQKIPLYCILLHMGSVQQIDNNRWLIGCGISRKCSARMINNTGAVLWEMQTNEKNNMYKAYYYQNLDK